jgi:hypothetical protein
MDEETREMDLQLGDLMREVKLLKQGITLRDYFAAKAMPVLIANFLEKELDQVDPIGWMDGLAMDAYSMADAMLKERNDSSAS